MFKNSKVFANNWVITLTATLVGVFAALYLNEWVSSKKLSDQKSIATKNILTEISNNAERLERTIHRHIELNDGMAFLEKYLDDEKNLIAPADQLNELRAKHPNLVSIEDSTLLREGVYKYDGEIHLDLSLPHFELTTISWKTLKYSNLSTSFSFECLMYLATVENVTNEVLQRNKELVNYFIGAEDSDAIKEKLLRDLKLLIEFEESLQSIYRSGEEVLKKCA